MSTVLFLAVVALVGFVAYWAWRHHIFMQIDADRRAEITQSTRTRRRAETQINQMTASAIHRMVEAMQRSHLDPPSSR